MSKKNLPTHNEEVSTPLPPKVIETKDPVVEGDTRTTKHTDGSKGTPLPRKTIETAMPSYEGEVSKTKYSVEDYEAKEQTDTLPQSKSGEPYPFPHDDIDLYAVDTRIWDRIGEMGGGEGGAPHTHDGLYAPTTHEHSEYLETLPTHDHPHGHDEYSPKSHLHPEYAGQVHDHPHNHDGDYADAQALADHLANHPTGDGGGYDDTALTARVEQNETDIDALEAENNSQNLNIQANTDALGGKSDSNHTHPPQDLTHNHDGEYAGATHGHDEFMTLQNQINNKSDKTHTHPPQDTTHNHDGTYQPAGNYADATHDHTDYVKGEGASGLAMWIGSQADYDAISNKRLTTLYVVL